MEEKVADPGPLGLAAFAMTTFCINSANAGWWHGDGATGALALAVAYGGLAQLLAGMWEFVVKNTFAAVAFTSYGAFWLGLYLFVRYPVGSAGTNGEAVLLLGWTIFTAYMMIAAIKVNKAVLTVFVLLTVTFLCLTLGAFGHAHFIKIGGYTGLLTALAAWYASAAAVINSTHGKTVLPVG